MNQGSRLKKPRQLTSRNITPKSGRICKRAAKDMEKMLSAHRTRIEHLLMTQRAIAIGTLSSCYLDHPLLGGYVRAG